MPRVFDIVARLQAELGEVNQAEGTYRTLRKEFPGSPLGSMLATVIFTAHTDYMKSVEVEYEALKSGDPDRAQMQAAAEKMDGDIRKFEEIGTHPAANYLAIAEALTFHQGIGAARKEARLVYLRDYWARRLLENDRVRLHTSLKPGFACGIANVQVEDVDTLDLVTWLWKEYRIIVTPINHDEFTGIRVSPSVYTTIEELDRFVDAMRYAMRYGSSVRR